VRELAEPSKGNGLRVIVDGSPNSLPPELKTTNREFVINVELMERTELESIDEFKDLISILRKYQLNDVAWKVFGGTPADYNALLASVRIFKHKAGDVLVDDLKKIIHFHMIQQLEVVIKSCEKTKKIIDKFRTEKKTRISIFEIEVAGLLLEYPNEVFREVCDGVNICVVAANPAIEIIIVENIIDFKRLATYLENAYLQVKVDTINI
jgi:hypothetical protein